MWTLHNQIQFIELYFSSFICVTFFVELLMICLVLLATMHIPLDFKCKFAFEISVFLWDQLKQREDIVRLSYADTLYKSTSLCHF